MPSLLDVVTYSRNGRAVPRREPTPQEWGTWAGRKYAVMLRNKIPPEQIRNAPQPGMKAGGPTSIRSERHGTHSSLNVASCARSACSRWPLSVSPWTERESPTRAARGTPRPSGGSMSTWTSRETTHQTRRRRAWSFSDSATTRKSFGFA